MCPDGRRPFRWQTRQDASSTILSLLIPEERKNNHRKGMNLRSYESGTAGLATARDLRSKAYREVTDVSDAVLLARF